MQSKKVIEREWKKKIRRQDKKQREKKIKRRKNRKIYMFLFITDAIDVLITIDDKVYIF